MIHLIDSFGDSKVEHEVAADRIVAVLDRYQEQPSIIDPSLDGMVTLLLRSVRVAAHGACPTFVVLHACRVMYTLCKVRGYKTIVKFCPHDVTDLEPLVHLLAKYPPEDCQSWQVAYSLMVWLSTVVMVPFDLSIIDSSVNDRNATAASTLVQSIERLAIGYLSTAGPACEAAAILLARLLTRPGLQTMLCNFVSWSGAELTKGREGGEAVGGMRVSFLLVGIFSTLAQIFKLGHRAELLPQLPLLGALATDPSALVNDTSVLRRKLGVKLLQRVAAVHLPPRVAVWRYQRGARSLEMNLQLTIGDGRADEGAAAEEEEVPEQIEEILEQLLHGLRDADTVVRWSAAKGIGRVTSRLALEMADDVVVSVLELLTSQEEANAWHGGCLALAELSRRGLLLPTRLVEVLPRITIALHYDVARGAASVGTHVRDAACYVCWAFARAFEPCVMVPHVAQLAQALLTVVCLDREVNCRRAASAAFQENVGRQGNFPHGIEIVTRADYFSVGSRPNAYLEIGRYIGSFDEYRLPLLIHLSTVKFKHWDVQLRLLAAQSAARLTPFDREYTLDAMLPFLIGKTLSPDLKSRHGATHMLAECLLGLVNELHGGEGKELSAETRKAVVSVVPSVEKARLYRGRGGEVMRSATCRLLEVQALLKFPTGSKLALKTLQGLEDSLKHPTETISLAAVAALKAISNHSFAAPPPPAEKGPPPKFEELVPRYIGPLKADPNAALRRGFTLALGVMPAAQLHMHLGDAAEVLMSATVMEVDVAMRDPEVRRNAVHALLQITDTFTRPYQNPLKPVCNVLFLYPCQAGPE